MNRTQVVGLQLMAAIMTLLISATGWSEPRFTLIPFNDILTEVPITFKESWNSVGIDPHDNVYAIFGGPTTDRDSEDVALFQYNARSGKKRVIGTISEAMKAANNFREEERIPKGHCTIVYINEKMYFGVQNFHDAYGNPEGGLMKTAAKSRGAHLFAYDLKSDKIEDLSASQPEGVFFSGRGIIALAAVPNTNLLACQTIPQGDILVYDTLKNEVAAKVPGVEKELGRRVGRDIIGTLSGKIIHGYMPAGLNLPDDDGFGHAYAVDAKTGVRQEQPIASSLDGVIWAGQAISKDHQKIYLVTLNGMLSRLNWKENKIEELGSILPPDEQEQREVDGIHYEASTLNGIVLSKDEKYLYAMTTRRERRETSKPGARRGGAFGLTEYELATGQSRRIEIPAEVKTASYLGSNLIDSQGSIYFEYQGGSRESETHRKIGLIRIDFD